MKIRFIWTKCTSLIESVKKDLPYYFMYSLIILYKFVKILKYVGNDFLILSVHEDMLEVIEYVMLWMETFRNRFLSWTFSLCKNMFSFILVRMGEWEVGMGAAGGGGRGGGNGDNLNTNKKYLKKEYKWSGSYILVVYANHYQVNYSC